VICSVKAGGVRVTQSKKKPSDKKDKVAAPAQENLLNGETKNPAQDLGMQSRNDFHSGFYSVLFLAEKMHETKKAELVAAKMHMKSPSKKSKFPATYNPTPKPTAFMGSKAVNAKARMIQQPRKHNWISVLS